MPTDEFVQIDGDAADAIMESMPPVPGTELATETDVAELMTGVIATGITVASLG